jgi:hypothetical protein
MTWVCWTQAWLTAVEVAVVDGGVEGVVVVGAVVVVVVGVGDGVGVVFPVRRTLVRHRCNEVLEGSPPNDEVDELGWVFHPAKPVPGTKAATGRAASKPPMSNLGSGRARMYKGVGPRLALLNGVMPRDPLDPAKFGRMAVSL